MQLKTLQERLNKYIIKSHEGCWLWSSSHTKNVPIITINHKSKNVRTMIYEIYNPDIKIIGHTKLSCKNPRCINPKHLMNREEFFQSFIKKDNKTECWLWTGLQKGGYGSFAFNRKEELVHRIMHERHNGVLKKGFNVCHSCDTPLCVNPKHLWLGSQSDNVHDMISKSRDRKAYGENNHASTITEQDARNIKLKYKEGMKMIDIHKLLNISYRVIQHVCRGESWKHVEIPNQ